MKENISMDSQLIRKSIFIFFGGLLALVGFHLTMSSENPMVVLNYKTIVGFLMIVLSAAIILYFTPEFEKN